MSTESNPAQNPGPNRRTPEAATTSGTEVATNRSAMLQESQANLAPVVETPPRDIYQEALRVLRGRYPLAIFLGLLGAALGAAAGYVFKPPLYRSDSLLRIAYTLPPVMKETDQNRPIAMFEGYVKSQIEVMKSQRVLSAALRQPLWRQTGRGGSFLVIRDFIENVSIEHPGNTDYLHITYEDADPAVAAAAVNSLLEAYQND